EGPQQHAAEPPRPGADQAGRQDRRRGGAGRPADGVAEGRDDRPDEGADQGAAEGATGPRPEFSHARLPDANHSRFSETAGPSAGQFRPGFTWVSPGAVSRPRSGNRLRAVSGGGTAAGGGVGSLGRRLRSQPASASVQPRSRPMKRPVTAPAAPDP